MTEKDLQQTIETFLRHLAAEGYAKRTIKDYRYNLGYFLHYLTNNQITSFSQVTSETILSYQDYIHHEYKPVRKKTISLGFQVNLLKVLKVLFRYLVREGTVLTDPTVTLKMPKLPKRLPRNVLTKREIKKLLSAPDTATSSGFRDRTVLEILYSTGIRKSELEHLQLYDVDLSTRQLTIREGKGGKDRIIPLTKKATEVIERYITNHRSKLLADHEDTGCLILNDRGRYLGHKWPEWIIGRYVKHCKFKKEITTHSIRHTFATHLLQNKASIRVIQELLGHESLQSTQIYTKVEISDLRKAIDAKHPRETME